MEHTRDQRNQSRLRLLVLEDRTLPSALLATGIELDSLEDVTDNQQFESASRIHRAQSVDFHFTPQELAQTEMITAPAPFSKEVGPPQLAQATEISTNAAIHQPTTIQRFSVGGRNVMKKTLTNQAVNAKVTKLDLEHPRVIPHTRSFALRPAAGQNLPTGPPTIRRELIASTRCRTWRWCGPARARTLPWETRAASARSSNTTPPVPLSTHSSPCQPQEIEL